MKGGFESCDAPFCDCPREGLTMPDQQTSEQSRELSREQALREIGDVIAYWIEWITREREAENLGTTADTHVMLPGDNAPPYWPSVGQLKLWLKALRAVPDLSNVEELVETVARGIYAVRPFAMASTATTFGHQLAQTFDWDGAPAYYQEDMRDLARAAIKALAADTITVLLDRSR
jgi:hypothetical protein